MHHWCSIHRWKDERCDFIQSGVQVLYSTFGSISYSMPIRPSRCHMLSQQSLVKKNPWFWMFKSWRKTLQKGWKSTWNLSTSIESTSLHDAARAGNLEVVGFLIEAGSDVNKATSAGLTYLHLCMMLHVKLLACWLKLVQTSTSLRALDQDLRTLLSICRQPGSCSLLDWSWCRHPQVCAHWIKTLAQCFQFVGNLEVVHFLMKGGSDVYKSARIGSRPLHIAAICRQPGSCSLLDWSSCRHQQVCAHWIKTLAHGFQFVGNLEVVRFLIEAGADINKYARIGSRP